jgi:hypothetical protein
MQHGGTITTTEINGKVTKLMAKIEGDWITDEDLEQVRRSLAKQRPNVEIVIMRQEQP